MKLHTFSITFPGHHPMEELCHDTASWTQDIENFLLKHWVSNQVWWVSRSPVAIRSANLCVPDVVKKGKTKREREIEKGNNNHVTICLAGQLCFIAKFMTKLDFHRSQGQQSWVSQFQRFRGRAFQWGKCFCPGLLGTGVWFHHHMLPQRCPELATISHPIGVIKPLSLQERGHGLAKHRLLPSQQSAGRSLSQENGKTEGLEWRRWQHGVSKWFGEDVKMHEKSCINCKIGVWC